MAQVSAINSGGGSGSLHIDPGAMADLISRIRSAASEYSTCLTDITTEHGNLKQAWQAGGDVEAYMLAVDKHVQAMNELHEAILGAASDLQSILNAYMEAQAAIKGAINN